MYVPQISDRLFAQQVAGLKGEYVLLPQGPSLMTLTQPEIITRNLLPCEAC
jgi:hypothetical protein